MPIGISPKSFPWHCLYFQRSYILWVLLTKLLRFSLFCPVSGQQEGSERADLHTPMLSLIFSYHRSHLWPVIILWWLRNYNYFLNVYLGKNSSPKYLKYSLRFAAGGAGFFVAGLPCRRPEDFASTCNQWYWEQVSSRTQVLFSITLWRCQGPQRGTLR